MTLQYKFCLFAVAIYILCGSNTWGTATSSNIERLSKLQKRAAGIILKVDYSTTSALMFKEPGLESIPNKT